MLRSKKVVLLVKTPQAPNHLICFLLSCKPFPKISGSDCLHISTLHIPDYTCEIWSMNNNAFEINGKVPVTKVKYQIYSSSHNLYRENFVEISC